MLGVLRTDSDETAASFCEFLTIWAADPAGFDLFQRSWFLPGGLVSSEATDTCSSLFSLFDDQMLLQVILMMILDSVPNVCIYAKTSLC